MRGFPGREAHGAVPEYTTKGKVMFDLLLKLWNFLKWPLLAILVIYLLFVILYLIHLKIELKKANKTFKDIMKVHEHKKKRSRFKQLFYDFPRMMAIDRINRDPEEFPYQGMIIFEGRQGRGKSVAMIHCSTEMLNDYDQAKCISNLKYIDQDSGSEYPRLTDWRQLINFTNGALGVLALIDETQNWFNSKDSKNFPPEMVSVVTQNRKNRRVILGTAQSFYMLAKDIRTQCTEVRTCRTFFKCLTMYIRREPIVDSDGKVIKMKYLGFDWFVHTPELRDSYDTYEVIERFSKAGFVSRDKQLSKYNKKESEEE